MAKKCIWLIPTYHGSYLIRREKEIGICLGRRHSDPFSNTAEQHIDHAHKVLSLLYNNGATLKLKKFSFFTDKIGYLGHNIRLRRLELGLNTTNAISGLKPPTSSSVTRSNLGLSNVLRRFVSRFARIASLVNQRFKKTTPKHLHRLIAKLFKPWIYWRRRWYHLLCWHIHNLVDTWISTQTRPIYKLAASYFKSIQTTRTNTLVSGHNRSPKPRNYKKPRNQNI